MHQSAFEPLLLRLDQIERQNRRWRLLVLFLFLLLGGMLAFVIVDRWTGLFVPAQVAARSFTVLDENGVMRAELGSNNGNPRLALFDREGRNRLSVGVEASGAPIFTIADEQEQPRAALLLDAAGKAGLSLLDQQNRTRAALIVEEDGRTSLSILDDAGKPRALLGADAAGASYVYLYRSDMTRLWGGP